MRQALYDALIDHGLNPNKTRQTCPKCSSQRKKKHDPCLSLTIDSDEHAVWHCWHCGWGDGTRVLNGWASPNGLSSTDALHEAASYRSDVASAKLRNGIANDDAVRNGPEQFSESELDFMLPQAFYEEFKRRGISAATLIKARVAYCRNKLAFPYYREGVLQNVKFRAKGKRFSKLKSWKSSTLYGRDLCDSNLAPFLIITEGEIDQLSCMEAGLSNAVSIPDGAGSDPAKFMDIEREWLKQFEYFYLAMDADEAGKEYVPKLSTYLGAERCLVVAYPDQCKDANEVLTKHGRDAVVRLFDAQPQPEFIDAAPLESKLFKPLNWLVQDLLPTGLAIISGAPKLGKSWLALQLAISVAQGAPLFEQFQCSQSAVLYLALEDNERRLQSRLRSLLPDLRFPANLHFTTDWPNVDEHGIDKLDAALTRHPEIKLVIIDIFARIRGETPRGMSAYQADIRAIKPLHAIAHKHEACVLIISHNRKAKADDALELISGTFGLVGTVDTAWVMEKPVREEPECNLSITGRDIIQDGKFRIIFNRDQTRWTWHGHVREQEQKTVNQQIYDLLNNSDEALSSQEIADITGLPKATVGRQLQYMRVQKIVTRKPRRKWGLQGKAYARAHEYPRARPSYYHNDD